MCGILGLINRNKAIVDPVLIAKMNATIAHRGPDDSGLWVHQHIGLAHQRLSILDVTANGHQPMVTEDNQYVIVFNGEIYNHLAIRNELIAKGITFKSTSDTETLLYGYCVYGEQIVQKLNGIFSFAIYDRQKEEIFIARDHYGVKPLYYYIAEDVLLFSSEIKGLIHHPTLDKSIDYKSLMNYLNYLWSPKEGTPFKYVKKLEAGHFLKYSISKDSFSLVKYYDIPFNGTYKQVTSERELIFELEQKLNKAVERQLLSDVPVGFFVSGGLDSSLVAAIAKQQLGNEPVTCFTINTGESVEEEGFENDIYYARKLSKQLGLNLIELDANLSIINDFDKMIWHLDEPQADPAPLNVYNISKEARALGFKVLLGGTAGDDVFSGYRRHIALKYESYVDYIPLRPRKWLKGMALELDSGKAINRRIRKVMQNIELEKMSRMAGYFSWIPLVVNESLFSDQVKQELAGHNPSDILIDMLQNIPNEESDLNKMLYWEMKTFLPDHNLNYTDKMSMAAGLEARVPFLDRELVDFSASIDPSMKLSEGKTKFILRKVAEKYLPNAIIYRPKAGFGAPVRQWITYDLDAMIADRLAPEKIKQRGIFDEKAVWALINANKAGKIDASYTIWSLLAIESWMRQFVDGEKLF